MFISYLVPPGSKTYRWIQRHLPQLEALQSFRPASWFGFWCILLSGTNVAYASENRWLYWDFSAISFYVILAMFLVIPWSKLYFKHPLFPRRVNSLKDALGVLVVGLVLFLAGAVIPGWSRNVVVESIPYLLLYLANWLVFSIPLEKGETGQWVVSRPKPVFRLGTVILLAGFAAGVGFFNDDPVASTAAAVYFPFPLVALLFPHHIRHYQRARIYGVFIPAVFIGMRLPWFFIPLTLLFWGLRYYHYFRSGEVFPTFKVDLE